MSVLLKLLILVTCLSMLATGAPNKNNDENFHSLAHLRPRNIPPNPTKYTRFPSLTAPGNTRALSNNSFVGGSGWFPMPSDTAHTGSSFGSSGVVPYPTKGAPYQNSTSLYTVQGNREGENGQSGSGNQCPPQQTVTLPPRTINLPAQTVTMTPALETVTITLQAQTETVTVTVTPQTQITTVTVWVTVTANQAPSCPSPNNAANPQSAPVPAPNAQPLNTPVVPALYNASTAAIVPPIVTTAGLVVPLSTGDTAPIANATSPIIIPNLSPTTKTGPPIFPTNNQNSSVAQLPSSSLVSPIITSTPIIAPYPYRNTTNQTLPFGSGSSRGFRPTGSGFAKPTNRHFSSYFLSKFVTDTPISTTTIGPSPTREYFPGNGSSLLTPQSQANATTFHLTAGSTAPPSPTREYFPDDGSSLLTPPAQANATASPTREYFLDDGSSLLTPPAQANATSILPMSGPTAPCITPAVVGSSQTLVVVVDSATSPPIIQLNTTTLIPPVSTPMPPPSPPIVPPNTSIPLSVSTSSSQTSQPPPASTPPLCTNGTTTQNITTNFSEIPPIPSMPLILQGLNYTTFTPFTATSNSTSPLPPPTHLLGLSASEPKQIALAPSSLSFSLTSLSLSCGDAPSEVTANCTVQMFGIGAASTGSGATSGMERAVAVGPGMQTVRMEGAWEGLSKVTFSAEMGGTEMGVRLGGVVYELVSAC